MDLDEQKFAAAITRLEMLHYLYDLATPEQQVRWIGLEGNEVGLVYMYDMFVEDLQLFEVTSDQVEYFGFSDNQAVLIREITEEVRQLVKRLGYDLDNSRYVQDGKWKEIGQLARQAFVSLQRSR